MRSQKLSCSRASRRATPQCWLKSRYFKMLCYRQVNYLIPLPFTSLILSHPCTPSSALSLTPSSHHTLKHTGVVGRQGVPCFGHPPCHLFINSSAWVPAVIILTTPPHPSAHYSSVLRQRQAGVAHGLLPRYRHLASPNGTSGPGGSGKMEEFG